MSRTEGWEYLENIYFPSQVKILVDALGEQRDPIDIYRAQGAMSFHLKMINDIGSRMNIKEVKEDE